jgi:hypothetical protein
MRRIRFIGAAILACAIAACAAPDSSRPQTPDSLAPLTAPKANDWVCPTSTGMVIHTGVDSATACSGVRIRREESR